MMKKTVGIVSLGCPRNLVDSEHILGRLTAKGYCVTDIDKARVGIVNTCAFIQDAKRESVDAILDLIELKNEGKLKKVLVFGCLAERYARTLRKQLPEVDAFVGRVSLNHSPKAYPLTPAHFAYLKVCEGCVNACSYCVIPRIKGKFVSLPEEAVLGRAEELDKRGVSELNLVGQDTTAYGLDTGAGLCLPELLKKIASRVKHAGWIRLLYLYPSRVSDELLKVIAGEPRICKYIDLPVQHINGRILSRMGRKTTGAQILKLIDKVRKTVPGAVLRTSLIVGFPSETEREFGELLRFIEDVQFERLGAFMYSREEGTPAFSFKKQIPEKVKRERFEAVMLKQKDISSRVNAAFLGKKMQVLIDEEPRDGGLYAGRSQGDAPEVDGVVYVKSPRRLHPGEFTQVKITDTLEYDLVGEVTS